ncbi:MAG: TIGR02281 family clan AA aspartic protease [Mariprofundaceae bacterium]
MLKVLLSCCLLFSLQAHAEVYQWKDDSGRTHFSDIAVQGSQKHDMPKLSSIKNPNFNLQRNNNQIHYTDRNGSMIVQAQVNKVDMEFIVDTGASLVVIPPEIAKQARISTKNAPIITAQTANGAVQTYMVSLAHLQVGQLKQQHVRAAIQKVSPNPRIGLLGMSFLKAYRMSIDHDKHIITLEAR